MPSIIINADASASSEFILPFDGFLYLNFLRQASDLSRNLVPGQPSPVAAGSPVVSGGYAALQGLSKYIDASVQDPGGPITLAAVCRAPSPGGSTALSPLYIGNYASTAMGGMGVNIYGHSASGAAAGTRGSLWVDDGGLGFAGQITLGASDSTQWALRVLRVSTDLAEMIDVTNDLTASYTLPNPRDASNTRTFRIGSGYSVFGAEAYIASAAIIDHRVTDDEIDRLHQVMRHVAALDGIVV